jgi:hypothetical protein
LHENIGARGGKMKRFVAGGFCASLLIFLVLACCFPPSATKVGTSATTPTTKSGQPTTNKEFKVGDKIQIGDRVVTIGTVTRNYVSSNQYIKPQDGKEWIIVPVVIENKGADAITFSQADFKIQDSKGGRTFPTFIVDLQNEMQFGEIAPSGKIEGNIPFEVTTGDTPLKLVFKPLWGLGGEVIVGL